jgi:hypothetical protein
MPDNLTVDNNTAASTPGRLALNRLQWFRCYPKWPLIWGVPLLGFLYLAVYHGWGWWFLAVPCLGMNFLYWTRVREHFGSGDVCPAMVISEEPLLIAVGTYMTTGNGNYPVIKVMSVPSASLPRRDRVAGTRLATVALYSGRGDEPHWRDFDPRPAGAATTNPGMIEEAFDRISEGLWMDFDFWYRQVPELDPGLHFVKRLRRG